MALVLSFHLLLIHFDADDIKSTEIIVGYEI